MSKFIEHINVPTEIKEIEKDFYHVLMVDGAFNQVTLEANYTAKKQVFGRKSWEKIKGKLTQIGVQNAYILHDPTYKAENSEAGAGNKPKKPTRQELIEEAKALGWDGALNAKNDDYIKFIEDAKEVKQAENSEAGADDVNAGDSQE